MGEILTLQRPEPDIYRPADFAAWEQQLAFPQWVDAEAIAAVAADRLAGRAHGEGILEQRMDLLREGAFDQVPHVVDPLTTAGRAVEAERLHGRDSEQYRVARHSLYVDSSRLLTEAARPRTWEYFPPLEQPYEDNRGYVFMGHALMDIVSDGVTPVAEEEEQSYRLGEVVEEVTYGSIRRLGRAMLHGTVEAPETIPAPLAAAESISVNTISECSDWAITAYEQAKKTEQKAELGGYVPEVEKLMVRGVRYDHERDVRFQEQVGISGEYITRDVVIETMRRLQVIGEEEAPDKIAVRSKQMIDPSGQGALNLVRMLDQVAGEQSGENIFMGEVVPADHAKDYDAIPAEAVERQRQLEGSAEELTEYLLDLERKGTDHFAAGGLVHNFAQKLLLKLVQYNPEQAAVIFDAKTAAGVTLYVAHIEAGDHHRAEEIWLQVQREAPALAYCGADSCGLEKVSAYSKEGMKAKEMGLEADGDEEILHDTIRSCDDCGAKEIYYTSETARKLCANCGKKDTKGKARQNEVALAA